LAVGIFLASVVIIALFLLDIKNEVESEYQNIFSALRKFKVEYEAAGTSKRDVFSKYYETLSPEIMLTLLEESFPQCHTEGHELGMVILEEEQDFVNAIKLCDHQCTGGCMHGVVLEEFSQNSYQGLVANLESFCKRAVIADLYKPGNCAHSLGHALMMVSSRDLELALQGCVRFKLGAMRYYCASGAYMEYFNTIFRPIPLDGFHGPCDKYDLYPAACYRYKTTEMAYMMENDWERVIAECDALSNAHRLGCYHGLGHGVRQAVMNGEFSVADVCEGGRPEDAQICIEGAIEKWSDWDRPAAAAACDPISDELKPICLAAANDGMYRLDKPTLELYLAFDE
jgi:hypothetical protein